MEQPNRLFVMGDFNIELNSRNIFEHCKTAASPAQIEAALRRVLVGATQSSLGSLYIFDLAEQCNIYCDVSLSHLLGYSYDDALALRSEGLAHLIKPDYLEAVAGCYQRWGTLEAETVHVLEYQMKRSDGTWCWLRSHDTPLLITNQGTTRQILGLVQVLDSHQCESNTSSQIREVQRSIVNIFHECWPSDTVGIGTAH